MVGWQEIIGLLVCVGIPLVVVAALIWATRRPKCPNCQFAVSPGDTVCGLCGQSLQPPRHE